MMFRKEYGQKGIAAVEFGLIAPIVLVILFAIFEFGTAFSRKQVLTSAVRHGVRKAIIATNPKMTTAQVRNLVYAYLDGVGYDAGGRTVSCSGCAGASGATVTVTATYPTSFLILSRLPLGSGVDSKVNGSGIMTLSASVKMQME